MRKYQNTKLKFLYLRLP